MNGSIGYCCTTTIRVQSTLLAKCRVKMISISVTVLILLAPLQGKYHRAPARPQAQSSMCGPRAGAVLQSSSSQKHMWPLVLPSVMQTWSTMNRLMSRASVHVRRIDSDTDRGNVGIIYSTSHLEVSHVRPPNTLKLFSAKCFIIFFPQFLGKVHFLSFQDFF